MKIAIVISTNDTETIFNAFRFANYCIANKETVKVFLIGKGVEAEQVSVEKFNVLYEMNRFVDGGGKILSCGSCLIIRNSSGTELCPLNTMNDLYEMIKEAHKVLSF